MGFSNRQSMLFGNKGYVYYNTFGDSEEPYNQPRRKGVENSLDRTLEDQIQIKEITTTLQSIADIEYEKEIAFINQLLGASFNKNFIWKKEFIKNMPFDSRIKRLISYTIHSKRVFFHRKSCF